MKKLIVIILMASASLTAQIDATVNPIGLLFGNLSVGADFVISPNLSVDGQIGFGAGDLDSSDWKNFVITAFGKYYFNPQMNADRFYIGAFIQNIIRSYDYGDNSSYTNYDQNRFGLGFGVGWKIVSKGNFVFDANVGIGRALFDKTKYSDDDGEQYELDWTDVMATGKLAIGYRFGNK